ncbi:hypothetical protein CPG37_04610 [Malaciobacter canalis]|uniref:Phage major tail tube protein n=2 Tax=Malaciobacter canalis TaxID=1912871 RepID=A0ABX4LUZ8_9BACT|nr:hypothetical protein CPG37_04610 [Malaciobacter canalis]
MGRQHSMKYPQTLTDFNIFIGGIGHLGTSKKVSLPKIEQIRETITAGGFERSVDTGVFKELESEFILSEFSSVIFSAMSDASKTADGISIEAKGSIFQGGERISIVATFKGSVDIDDGDFEAGKQIERKISMKLNRYILEIDGKEMVMLDTINMIAKIDGKDLLEDLRSHIQ